MTPNCSITRDRKTSLVLKKSITNNLYKYVNHESITTLGYKEQSHMTRRLIYARYWFCWNTFIHMLLVLQVSMTEVLLPRHSGIMYYSIVYYSIV